MTSQRMPSTGGAATRSHGSDPSPTVEQRREDLIAATIAVLAERGLPRATTRAITARAGLALGAFHYAFASKDELLGAVMERMADTLDGLLIDPVDGPTATGGTDAHDGPVAPLTWSLRRLWQALEDAPDEQLAQFELTLHARREPGLAHLAGRRQERLVAAIARAVRPTPGPLDEAGIEELARAAADHLDGLLLHQLVEQDPEEGRRRLERYLASLDAVVASHAPATPRANGR